MNELLLESRRVVDLLIVEEEARTHTAAAILEARDGRRIDFAKLA